MSDAYELHCEETKLKTRVAKKIALICCFLSLILGLAEDRLPLASADSWVLEDSAQIALMNKYYSIRIPKSGDGYGAISYLEISGGENILSTSFVGLGAHEYSNLQTGGFPAQWRSEPTEVIQSVGLLANTPEYAIVHFKARWSDLIVEEWKTFYYDKPYYAVSYKRTFMQDIEAIEQDQVCFLFDSKWISHWVYRKHDGTLVLDDPTDFIIPMEQYAVPRERFPWVYFSNSSNNEGFGIILIGVSRPKLTGINPYYFSAGNYVEFQITHDNFRHGVSQNYVQTASYVGYTSKTSDYSGIESLAIDLFAGDYETSSYLGSTGSQTGKLFAPSAYAIEPCYSTQVRVISHPIGFGDAQYTIQPRFTNSTGTYDIFVSPLEISSYWTVSYANKTWSKTYEDKIGLKLTVEVYNNSDTVTTMFEFDILRTMNITRLESPIVGFGSIYWKTVNSTFAYINFTDSTLFYGCAVKNSGETGANFASDATIHFLSNAQQQSHSVQSLHYTFQWQAYIKRTQYDISDWLPLTEANWLKGENCWVNLYDAVGFKVNAFSETSARLLYHIFADNELTLWIDGDYGTISTTKVYVGDKGMPKDVNGAASWNYNSTSKTLTIIALHTSPITITVKWTPRGDINDDGTVDTSDLSALGEAFGSTGGPPPSANWNIDADLNVDNHVSVSDLYILGKNYGKSIHGS